MLGTTRIAGETPTYWYLLMAVAFAAAAAYALLLRRESKGRRRQLQLRQYRFAMLGTLGLGIVFGLRAFVFHA